MPPPPSGLTAGQRRAVAARVLADEEEGRAALAAPGVGGAIVQAYPVGKVVRRSHIFKEQTGTNSQVIG